MPPEPRETLLTELREHALVIGEVTLSSGQTAQYYVDAKRALLRPAAFRAAGELIAAEAGCRTGSFDGGPVHPSNVLVATPSLFAVMVEVLRNPV